jgi:hypothetical protein
VRVVVADQIVVDDGIEEPCPTCGSLSLRLGEAGVTTSRHIDQGRQDRLRHQGRVFFCEWTVARIRKIFQPDPEISTEEFWELVKKFAPLNRTSPRAPGSVSVSPNSQIPIEQGA